MWSVRPYDTFYSMEKFLFMKLATVPSEGVAFQTEPRDYARRLLYPKTTEHPHPNIQMLLALDKRHYRLALMSLYSLSSLVQDFLQYRSKLLT